MNKKYMCSSCGKEHAGFPALTFKAPYHYHVLSEEDKRAIAEIDTDFCIITYPDRIDRFIRVVLLQKLIDSCENLDYGVWVSLSEKNFNDYLDNFDSENHETSYFGWLCSQIPEYDNKISIKTTVYTQKGNHRPIVIIHSDEDRENKFVNDYFEGITEKEAQERVDSMIGNENK